MSDHPPPLEVHLDHLAARLGAADGLLLVLDFDGTLAPIVPDPADAAVLPATGTALADLRDVERVTVAVVSGRALSDLRERVDAAAYAGNHGLELASGGRVRLADAAAAAGEDLAAACDAVERRVAGVDGAVIERKGLTATVHYRQADEADVPAVERAVHEVAGEYDSLRVTDGKAVRELRPDVDWDKGDAVEWLRETCVPPGADWTTVYVGDDRTDEDAFRALDEGLCVAVGDGAAGADYRVDDPEGLAVLLSWLATYGQSFLRPASGTPSVPE